MFLMFECNLSLSPADYVLVKDARTEIKSYSTVFYSDLDLTGHPWHKVHILMHRRFAEVSVTQRNAPELLLIHEVDSSQA